MNKLPEHIKLSNKQNNKILLCWWIHDILPTKTRFTVTNLIVPYLNRVCEGNTESEHEMMKKMKAWQKNKHYYDCYLKKCIWFIMQC